MLPAPMQVLDQYGGMLLLPMAVLEGPVVAMVAGVLCARGSLDPCFALLALIGGDLIGDLVLYWLGRSGMASLGVLGRHFAVVVPTSAELSRLQGNWAKLLLIGKWTHAVGAAVLLAAGAARLNLARFTVINLLATLPKVGLLFAAGYFAWSADLFTGVLPEARVFGAAALLGGGALAIVVARRHLSPAWVGSRR